MGSRIIKIIFLLSIGSNQLLLAMQDPLVLSQFIMRQAENENKLIFLYVGSDVCLESRSFLSEIVNDKEYYKFIKTNFIVSILDYDKNPSLAVRYSLPTIPGFLIIDSNGNTFFGTTRPEKQVVLPVLQLIVDKFTSDRQGLLDDLKQFRQETSFSLPNTIDDIIDSTMNVPNHISLDLGRYILSLSKDNQWFKDYTEQLLEWIKSENFDYVEGSFFMPRGFSTFHGESKYSFFNFKLQEMLLDFYAKTNNAKFKYAFLKSLKYLKRDLFLDERISYSTGYASKRYFKMNLKQRLQYYPPSPRRSDLALSQIIYLKILCKISILLQKKKLFQDDISFLSDHLNRRLSLFSQIMNKYKRKDGLLYFTSKKYFTNFETQVEFFALLQLMEKTEEVNPDIFLRKMENLYKSFVKAFFDREVKMFSDVPLESFQINKNLYQYKLYFTREHTRLLLFLDFLHNRTGKSVYQKQKLSLMDSINKQLKKFPERFYWLNWYQNLSKK